ncbi:helix-turn-helix domain-containing protein [Parvularcula maris]|uniref:Helix-turn-helix domain-containing protein n=1 Tax=Parvularcula maris TaxID=2965077 RepID=A0A9X2LAG6_9PROT|nr:helix-turn-helix transcriptional regulator [Parvularcula maris]MCQ8185889.1 helix-turn-helix domain-containing protein [Parvularcula maris]
MMETDKKTVDENEIARRIGRDIRAARKRKGWSQSLLAEQVGLKCGSTIQRFEAGKRYPELLLVLKLARVLELPVLEAIADFLGRELPSSSQDQKYRTLARALVTSDALTSSTL